MKANELRVGNLVNYDQALHIIGGHSILMIEEGKDIELFKPILLTEEWLVKFGFRTEYPLSNERNYYNNNKYVSINYFNGGFRLNVNRLIYGGIKIRYIHQLQNLYFSLTGEELELK